MRTLLVVVAAIAAAFAGIAVTGGAVLALFAGTAAAFLTLTESGRMLTKTITEGFASMFDEVKRVLGGISDMSRLPGALFVVDIRREHIAVDEARKLDIPVIAMIDTNCDPDLVDFPIPANDDAMKSVALITRHVADAVAEGASAGDIEREEAEAEAETREAEAVEMAEEESEGA